MATLQGQWKGIHEAPWLSFLIPSLPPALTKVKPSRQPKSKGTCLCPVSQSPWLVLGKGMWIWVVGEHVEGIYLSKHSHLVTREGVESALSPSFGNWVIISRSWDRKPKNMKGHILKHTLQIHIKLPVCSYCMERGRELQKTRSYHGFL